MSGANSNPKVIPFMQHSYEKDGVVYVTDPAKFLEDEQIQSAYRQHNTPKVLQPALLLLTI